MGLKMLLFSMVYGLLKGRNMKHPGMVFGVPNSENTATLTVFITENFEKSISN